MLTEFHGDPVAGGTFPALIWKSFMETALPYLKDDPAELPVAEHPGVGDARGSSSATARTSSTTGSAGNTISVPYFDGRAPDEDRELQAERGRGAERRRDDATTSRKARLAAQPLTPVVVYKPASRGQALHVVVKQIPAKGGSRRTTR